MRKTLFTLNIDHYAPEITALTYPFLRRYAHKIGAEFQVISERKFPAWPVVYEKLQIFELGRDNDWNIYIDSDALVHPDMFDVCDHLAANTVAHNASDMAGNRWRYDRFFRRDGRHIGSCNWFTVASGECIDLWRPLEIPLEEAMANIFPIVSESNAECFGKEHLIDDYTLSRNIAQFGLKFSTVRAIMERNQDRGNYLWHVYTVGRQEKLKQLKEVMRVWGISPMLVRAHEKGEVVLDQLAPA